MGIHLLFHSVDCVDKQQDMEMPRGISIREGEEMKAAPMSQIVGVRRLHHSNSFTGAVPRYGVELEDDQELTQVQSYFYTRPRRGV